MGIVGLALWTVKRRLRLWELTAYNRWTMATTRTDGTMPTFQHYGLYFTEEHLRAARRDREREPFRSAWALLDDLRPEDEPAALLTDALRFALNEDSAAGERAVAALQTAFDGDRADDLLRQMECAALLVQVYELTRGHPAFAADARRRWLERCAAMVDELAQRNDERSFVEWLWGGLTLLTAGIALEDEQRFEAGAAIYREAIDQHVRPEGYLPRAVEGGSGSLERQLRAAQALALMAEAAAGAGVDLWGYAARGVTATTAASYCVFYYFYPEQWPWQSGLDDSVRALYREHGAFLEIVNRHARPRTIQTLLDEIRPCFNPYGGGLTTLTHALPARRGFFG